MASVMLCVCARNRLRTEASSDCTCWTLGWLGPNLRAYSAILRVRSNSCVRSEVSVPVAGHLGYVREFVWIEARLLRATRRPSFSMRRVLAPMYLR